MNAPGAFPLTWPQGWPRTEPHLLQYGQFKVTAGQAQRELGLEVERLGGLYPLISSNVPLRRDGLPYADASRRVIDDPGVAVYFERGGRQMVFACDQYDMPWKNIRAIGKTIEAMRAIERYGASDMLERALSAFEALPPPAGWRSVLGYQPHETLLIADVHRKYRELVKDHHPDAGGDNEQLRKLNLAMEQAREEIS